LDLNPPDGTAIAETGPDRMRPSRGRTPGSLEIAMKILVGVDDSPHSRAAVEFVMKMSWPKGTRVLVLAAVRPMVGAYLEAYVPGPDVAVKIEEEQMHHFQELTARTRRELHEAGLAAESRAVRGDPREALLDAARAEGSDLIVVGSHGRTGITKLLIGSVASQIVTHAPCSVMVVKIAAAASEPAGRQSLKARQPGTTSREEPHSWG
jgi:nucleotide-binding universal stress UspA family protein